MKYLWISIDRREDIASAVKRECISLEESVQGLRFTHEDDWADADDQGRFRDFVAIARAAHDDPQILEWVAEELVDRFGWKVDVRPGD